MKPQEQQQKPKAKLVQFLETLESLFIPTTKRYILKGKSKPLAKDFWKPYDTEAQESEESDLQDLIEEFPEDWF